MTARYEVQEQDAPADVVAASIDLTGTDGIVLDLRDAQETRRFVSQVRRRRAELPILVLGEHGDEWSALVQVERLQLVERPTSGARLAAAMNNLLSEANSRSRVGRHRR